MVYNNRFDDTNPEHIKTFTEGWCKKFNINDNIAVYGKVYNSETFIRIVKNNQEVKLIGYKKGKIIDINDDYIIVKYNTDNVIEKINKHTMDISYLHFYDNSVMIDEIERKEDDFYFGITVL